MLIHGAADGQGISHLAECALNGLLVLGHSDFPLHLGSPMRGPGARIENRHDNLRRITPCPLPCLEKSGKVAAGTANGGGQRNAREKCRPGRADVGIGRLEQILGLQYIRPAQEHFRRQAGANFPGRNDTVQQGGKKVRRRRRANQEIQSIFVQRDQLMKAGDVPASAIHLGLRALNIQICRKTQLVPALDHLVSAPLGRESILRHGQALTIGSQSQIRVGHGRD